MKRARSAVMRGWLRGMDLPFERQDILPALDGVVAGRQSDALLPADPVRVIFEQTPGASVRACPPATLASEVHWRTT